ncbi:hypothetical protein ACFC8K_37685, partial [Streptomyces sp. NPDC055912]
MPVHKGAPALLSAGTLCAALLLGGCATTAPPAPAAPAGTPAAAATAGDSRPAGTPPGAARRDPGPGEPTSHLAPPPPLPPRLPRFSPTTPGLVPHGT